METSTSFINNLPYGHISLSQHGKVMAYNEKAASHFRLWLDQDLLSEIGLKQNCLTAWNTDLKAALTNQWVRLTCSPTTTGALITFFEIDDLKAKVFEYDTLTANLDEGFCIIEQIPTAPNQPIDFKYILTNKSFSLHTGLENVENQTIRTLLPNIEDILMASLEKVLQTGNTGFYHNEVAELELWIKARIFALPRKGQLAILFKNISTEMAADTALAESRAKLTALVELLPIGLAFVDIGGKLILGNPEMEKYMPSGLIPSVDQHRQVRWQGWDEFGNRITAENFPGQRAFRGERVVPGIEMLYTKDNGTQSWIQVSAVPVFGQKQEITGHVAIIVDIDEEKRNKQILQDAQRKQSFLLALSDALHTALDVDNIYAIACNHLSVALAVDTVSMSQLVNFPSAHLQVMTHHGKGLPTANLEIPLNIDQVAKLANGQFIDDSPGSKFEEIEPRTEPVWSQYHPLLQLEQVKFVFGLHHRQSKTYTLADMELIQEAALRINAEVERFQAAEKLRRSERHRRTAIQALAAEEKLRAMEATQQRIVFRTTMSAQEEERRRISESLHDGLAQLLYGTKLNLIHLKPQLAFTDPPGFNKQKAYVEQLLANAIKECRDMSHQLTPIVLEEFGLAAAIKEIIDRVESETKFKLLLTPQVKPLEKLVELAIFRIAQELMLNVVKHAKAKNASVEITFNSHAVKILVADDGDGLPQPVLPRTGIGLVSIRSKVNMLKGNFNIQSKPGKGASIAITLPLESLPA